MSTIAQRSFSGGEIGPPLYSRVDSAKYSSALRTCRNMIVMRHGGAQNRPGTKFIAEVKDSSAAVRLIPYTATDGTEYVCEFGNLYVRFYTSGAQLLESTKTITGITQANPAVVTTSGAHSYTTGQEVYISGIVGMTTLNTRNFKITVLSGTTFSLQYMDGTNVNSTAFTAWSSGGTTKRVFTLTTIFPQAVLSSIQYAQIVDADGLANLVLTAPGYAITVISGENVSDLARGVPTIVPDTTKPSSLAVSGVAGTVAYWKVTGVSSADGEESEASTAVGADSVPSAGAPRTLTWGQGTDTTVSRVYRLSQGIYSYIGAGAFSFVDNGITPDSSIAPPISRLTIFDADFPTVVGYYQQRLIFANSSSYPSTIWFSQPGRPYNFWLHSPLVDADSLTFVMSGRLLKQIRHIVDIGKLLIFSASGEFVCDGGGSGIILPGELNPRQHSYYGSSTVRPIVIGNTALFVQARGNAIRDLGFDYQSDGYRGNDLTIYAPHLFENYTITDMDYQQVPHSVLWAVRSDGTLLGLTYLREQQIIAWHRHDFDGDVENVCIVPEGGEDAVYLVVERTINSATKRYIERFHSRVIDDIEDLVIMDSSLSYDGTNAAATTMTLSGGTNWTYDETLTLTASASYFSASEVGNKIFMRLTDTDGEITDTVRCTITAYTSATVVSVQPHKTVPVLLRSVAKTTWARAVNTFTGLWHLEGKSVSVFADGFVVASPNNEDYTAVTVSSGSVTLDNCYAVVHIGLPIISDIETLDIDTAQGETLADKKVIINKVTMHVEKTRGVWVGQKAPTDDTTDPLEGLTEVKIRDSENYDSPNDLLSGKMDVIIEPHWASNGRVFIRQVDPVPMSILSVLPNGLFPVRGG